MLFIERNGTGWCRTQTLYYTSVPDGSGRRFRLCSRFRWVGTISKYSQVVNMSDSTQDPCTISLYTFLRNLSSSFFSFEDEGGGFGDRG